MTAIDAFFVILAVRDGQVFALQISGLELVCGFIIILVRDYSIANSG